MGLIEVNRFKMRYRYISNIEDDSQWFETFGRMRDLSALASQFADDSGKEVEYEILGIIEEDVAYPNDSIYTD